ncbi:MAG TPA: type II toxin-antitoxin system RelE/ParE family toxin [Stellaceae bacterium]|nr:type II toxin-antitoxin system RelE/ParE family toxin [Stellaceae bacterium]
MILGCHDKKTESFLAGERIARFQSFAAQAHRRLTVLSEAACLKDLRGLASNHFEALVGDRGGQYSIRINSQWRICFVWTPKAVSEPGMDPLLIEGDADRVEITDYH